LLRCVRDGGIDENVGNRSQKRDSDVAVKLRLSWEGHPKFSLATIPFSVNYNWDPNIIA
jgi:hypothetical protein